MPGMLSPILFLLSALTLVNCDDPSQALPSVGPWGNGPNFGVHWSLNTSNSVAYITYAATTLEVPGPVRDLSGETGAMGFYPALTNGDGDLIQSILATFARDP